MKRDYIEFQDRSVALAFLITFRCYGTWLHGDERGSVDRRYFNRHGGESIPSSSDKLQRRGNQLKDDPFELGARERRLVVRAIHEVCEKRGYRLYAVNVRTNHVHVVVSNSKSPERMMDSFKAYSTRALRAAGLVDPSQRSWSRHGSTKYLWTDTHIATAVEYVELGQGGELPEFD